MDVVKDQDGDLVVEASLLPKLAKSKYKRGSQEVVTKVTSDMLDDGQEANDFAQLQAENKGIIRCRFASKREGQSIAALGGADSVMHDSDEDRDRANETKN